MLMAAMSLTFPASINTAATVLECSEGPISEHLMATGAIPPLQVCYANPDSPKPPETQSLQTLGILSIACVGLMALRRTRPK